MSGIAGSHFDVFDEMYCNVIKAVMRGKNVDPDEIPDEERFDFVAIRRFRRSKRYYRIKGFASFSCPRCRRSWHSAHSWCVLDLREQYVAHKFGQECQMCKRKAKPRYTKPVYSRDDMTKMAEFAVDMYLRKIGRLPWRSKEVDAPVVVTGRPPHDEGRCEMCKALGRSCWKSAAVVQQQRELEQARSRR